MRMRTRNTLLALLSMDISGNINKRAINSEEDDHLSPTPLTGDSVGQVPQPDAIELSAQHSFEIGELQQRTHPSYADWLAGEADESDVWRLSGGG